MFFMLMCSNVVVIYTTCEKGKDSPSFVVLFYYQGHFDRVTTSDVSEHNYEASCEPPKVIVGIEPVNFWP